MKNAAKRQRLPNQQQAKQHCTPLIKALRMLKVEWLCFSSFFLGNTLLLIFYLSVFWSYSFLSTQKWHLHFKDSLNQVPFNLLSPKFILHKGQLMSFVASLFDTVVCYGNLKRESTVCITQPS